MVKKLWKTIRSQDSLLTGGNEYILTYCLLNELNRILILSHMSKIAWKNIDWSLTADRIIKIQRRIYKASRNNDSGKVHFLQKLLMNSLDAKLLSVKHVTTENRGCKIVGIDNKLYRSDLQKMKLVRSLKVDGKADPLKRVYIPKPGQSEKRPLGIPTIRDRTKQYLVLLALEPEWEAKFEPNSYGFRPGRSCNDAVSSIFGHLRLGKNKRTFRKYILDADIKGCFNNIDHQYLLNKLDTLPQIRNQVKSWLKAGIIEDFMKPEWMKRNDLGTPQEGILSPLLANIALHGMENFLKEWVTTIPEYGISKKNRMKRLGVIRYADDFLIIHPHKDVILKAKIVLSNWLKQTSGLELHEEKTSIICSTEGFSFLGFQFINIIRGNRMRIKIYPSKSSIKKISKKVGNICRSNRSISTYDLIVRLKPILTGWCNYFCYCECSYAFNKLDHITFNILRSWVFRRDRVNNRTNIKRKYFPMNLYVYRGKTHKDNWVLFGKKKMANGNLNTAFLPKFSWCPSQRHIKIRSHASVYDGNDEYWTFRTLEYGGFSYSQKRLLRRQNGLCTWCNTTININDNVEVDHVVPKSWDGKDSYQNLQLLHTQCHIEKSAFNCAKISEGFQSNKIIQF